FVDVFRFESEFYRAGHIHIMFHVAGIGTPHSGQDCLLFGTEVLFGIFPIVDHFIFSRFMVFLIFGFIVLIGFILVQSGESRGKLWAVKQRVIRILITVVISQKRLGILRIIFVDNGA